MDNETTRDLLASMRMDTDYSHIDTFTVTLTGEQLCTLQLACTDRADWLRRLADMDQESDSHAQAEARRLVRASELLNNLGMQA